MKKGYLISIGKKALFFETEATRKTPATVTAMLRAICNYRGFCEDMTARIISDKECYTRIQKEMDPATLELAQINGETLYKIDGGYFGGLYGTDEIIIA